MTIEEKVKEMLLDCGLFPDQAQEIVEKAKAEIEEMTNRWDEAVEDYPPVFLAALWFPVKKHALAWVDENAPNARFREMFTDE